MKVEDDNTKDDHPDASNKGKKKSFQGSELDEREDDDGDSKMDSACSRSSCVSVHSQLEMVNTGHKVAKPKVAKPKVAKPTKAVKESKLPEKKKKRRTPTGRIEKRLLPQRLPKTVLRRRLHKHRISKRKHANSTSTISTKRSSRTTSSNVGCPYCGHRCCRRRYEVARRDAFKKRRELRKLKTGQNKRVTQARGSESTQAGSRSLMLSPLCENMNVPPPEERKELPLHCEVTPEMIYESMRRLTMWQQNVATMAILEYMKINYPVNQDIPALFEELALKLQVAAIVGFVQMAPFGCWRLCGALQKRQELSPNHVTLFWTTYADTMKPVTKKIDLPTPPIQKEDNHSKSDEGIIKHDFDII